MPQRTVALVTGEHYHLYNRGHNHQPIFFDRENYLFFLRRVRNYLLGDTQTLEIQVLVVAYCLMPNHYHLLLCPLDNKLSRHMQRLSISYTKAINKRHNHTGALFQGQFQVAHVDQDEYLLHLSRYIHLNPVTAGLVEYPEDWEFSSYRDYVGIRQGTLPAPDIVLSQFPSPDAYRDFVEGYRPRDKEFISHLLLDDA